ncbi:MAG TPA: arginine--tRNA ligase [Candidatus Andersenbacteria bacterium]|nr:arginine--tRNA ligase [Candidatus Andersenbacteria bacterium]
MLNLQEALGRDIAEGIVAAGLTGKDTLGTIVVKHPEKEEHGDYASPVALSLSKKLGRPPLEIVEAIAKHMPKREYIGRLTAAPPGFLNIYLNPGWLTARLDNVVTSEATPEVPLGHGQSVNLEFISANPTGPLTLGNIRTAFSADVLGNVLACAGYNVTREYYINDAGGQIKKLGESVLRRILQAHGEAVPYGEELYQGDYITEVGRQLAEARQENEGSRFAASDLEQTEVVAEVGREAAVALLQEIKRSLQEDLRIPFDSFVSEQQLRDAGAVANAVERLRAKGVTYTNEGAEWFRTTDFGDSEDRVLVKSDGEYGYIAPDVAYHLYKYEREFDLIITFLGADHQGHGPKLIAAMQALGQDTERLKIVTAQWMRVVSGGKPVSLSKRKGHIVTPADLIAEVGLDAARFLLVQHSLKTHLDFDLDLAKERSERNPVYYVQYAYVRLQSLLRQAKQRGLMGEVGLHATVPTRLALTHSLEVALMRQLYRLPEVVAEVARSLEAQHLAVFALEVARATHVYYRHVPILSGEDEPVVASRLQLVLATRAVLGRALDLLGLNKPDVM